MSFIVSFWILSKKSSYLFNLNPEEQDTTFKIINFFKVYRSFSILAYSRQREKDPEVIEEMSLENSYLFCVLFIW